VSVRLDYWFSIEKYYYLRCWDEFVRAAEEVVLQGETLPYFFTMLAVAHRRRGNKEKATRCLRNGINKHPDNPLCYSALGTMLACSSKNDQGLRLEALSMWRQAIDLSGGAYSTQHLTDEIGILQKLPIAERYPPVSQAVQRTIDQLRACGMFFGLTSDDVIALLVDDVGVSMLRNDWMYPGDILSVDDECYLSLEYAFKTEITMANIVRLSSIYVDDVSEEFTGGSRHVKFKIAGRVYSSVIKRPEDLITLVNGALLADGRTRSFYQIDDGQGHLREFLLITQTEATALEKTGLLPRIHSAKPLGEMMITPRPLS
jgi:hypothetical protein